MVEEIQKLPVLLDEVHLLIEEHGFRFIVTGSSARKLRRTGVNLLGGRALNQYLHPLTFILTQWAFEKPSQDLDGRVQITSHQSPSISIDHAEFVLCCFSVKE